MSFFSLLLRKSLLGHGGFEGGLGLVGQTLLSSAPGVLGSLSSGGRLVGEHFGSLALVLVLVAVTLALQVKLVVHVSVDLLVGTRLFEQSPEHSHPLHPHFFDWGSRVGATESLTGAGVSTESSSGEVGSYAGSAVNGDLLFDDEAILDVSSDVVSAVSVADSQGLVWVEPDLVSAAVENRSGQALLEC